MKIDADVLAVGAQYAGHVRQVILSLRVGRLHTLQRTEERARLKAIDTGVDLLDLFLRGVGVPLLDYLFKASLFVAHDATVARRVVEADGKQRAGRAVPAMSAMLVKERSQGLRIYQRHVAGED